MTANVDRRNSTRDELEDAFDLPAEFARDDYIAGLYREIVIQLRSEARGIPMNTVQTLLLERIAYFYVSMKKAERDGEVSPRDMKDLIKFWLDMTTEFNKQLSAGHEKLREHLLISISQMVMERVQRVGDPDVRKELVIALREGFAEMGI